MSNVVLGRTTIIIHTMPISDQENKKVGHSSNKARVHQQQTSAEPAAAVEPASARSPDNHSSVDGNDFLGRQKRKLSNNQVIYRINTARRSSGGPLSFLRELFVILTTSTCFTLLLIIFMILPLSKIVMGSVYLDHCPAQPIIPIYLVVGGSIALIRDLAGILGRLVLSDQVYEQYDLPISGVTFVFSLGEFVWFVYGSVYVYRTLNNYQWTNRLALDYCNLYLYMFAFVITTLSYFVLAVGVLLTCAAVFMASVLNEEEKSQQTAIVILGPTPV